MDFFPNLFSLFNNNNNYNSAQSESDSSVDSLNDLISEAREIELDEIRLRLDGTTTDIIIKTNIRSPSPNRTEFNNFFSSITHDGETTSFRSMASFHNALRTISPAYLSLLVNQLENHIDTFRDDLYPMIQRANAFDDDSLGEAGSIDEAAVFESYYQTSDFPIYDDIDNVIDLNSFELLAEYQDHRCLVYLDNIFELNEPVLLGPAVYEYRALLEALTSFSRYGQIVDPLRISYPNMQAFLEQLQRVNIDEDCLVSWIEQGRPAPAVNQLEVQVTLRNLDQNNMRFLKELPDEDETYVVKDKNDEIICPIDLEPIEDEKIVFVKNKEQKKYYPFNIHNIKKWIQHSAQFGPPTHPMHKELLNIKNFFIPKGVHPKEAST